MTKRNKSKLPDYTLRAIANYQKKHDKIIFIGTLGLKDRITAMAPLGTKKRIQAILKTSGYETISAFAVSAILEKLEALEENKSDL